VKSLFPALSAALLLAACGSSSGSSSGSASATAASSSSTASSPTVIRTASTPRLGAVLVDAQGMTLYSLSVERGGKFICTAGACTSIWHPLSAGPGGVSGKGVGSLGTVKRPDGTTQVTYKGLPLYTFANDHAPGQAHGQGIRDVGTWSAATTGSSAAASSTPTSAATTPPASSTSSGGGGSYGY
jgi:predicted lipoprotein with Yx(FWY)xxD motif